MTTFVTLANFVSGSKNVSYENDENSSALCLIDNRCKRMP